MKLSVRVDPPYEDQDGKQGDYTIECDETTVGRVLENVTDNLSRLDPGQVPIMIEIYRTK